MIHRIRTRKPQMKITMKRINLLIVTILCCAFAMAQETDSIADTTAVQIPIWKQKLYFGYYFDIYFHHDSKANTKENGWSIAVEPEIGWKLKERVYLGMRLGGSYQDTYSSYTYEDLLGQQHTEDLRVMQGKWEVTPYVRYRLKTIFNDKVGIWLEAHAYTGMEYPRVVAGNVNGTNYDGLKGDYLSV